MTNVTSWRDKKQWEKGQTTLFRITVAKLPSLSPKVSNDNTYLTDVQAARHFSILPRTVQKRSGLFKKVDQ